MEAHDSSGGFGFGDVELNDVGGFGGDAPDTSRVGAVAPPSDGFGADAPSSHDGFGGDASATKPADGFGVEADKPGDEAEAPAPEHGLQAEGLHADELKLLADTLGEHQVDAKVGQEVLDRMLPALAARRAEAWQTIEQGWVDQKVAMHNQDATAAPRVKAAMSVLDPATREALQGEVFVEHPTLYRVLAEFGAFVQRATRQDTVVNGSLRSASPAPRFDPSDTSSRAFAGGLAGGF